MMPNSTSLLNLFADLWEMAVLCSGLPMDEPLCRPFWQILAAFCAMIGTGLICTTAWRYIQYRRQWNAAMLAQQQRDAIADEATMQQHRWIGDDNFSAGAEAPPPARF